MKRREYIRKRRYFILRRDIRSLCYYSSRENLTLLGSITLDMETKLSNVKPENADGFDNVISLQTEYEDGSLASYTLIKFETFESMKAWMLDIKNEAHNMIQPEDEDVDWWAALFDEVPMVEPKSNAVRREAHAEPDPVDRKHMSEPRQRLTHHSNATNGNNGCAVRSALPVPTPPLTHSSSAPLNTRAPLTPNNSAIITPTTTPSATPTATESKSLSKAAPCSSPSSSSGSTDKPSNDSMSVQNTQLGIKELKLAASEEESDDESDLEEDMPSGKHVDAKAKQCNSSKNPTELHVPNANIESPITSTNAASTTSTYSSPGASQVSAKHPSVTNFTPTTTVPVTAAVSHGSGGTPHQLSKKKIKVVKPEKAIGPPPFEHTTAQRFETLNGTIAGLQLSVRLCNVCTYQDRIFVVMFACPHDRKISNTSGSNNSGSTTSSTSAAANSYADAESRSSSGEASNTNSPRTHSNTGHRGSHTSVGSGSGSSNSNNHNNGPVMFGTHSRSKWVQISRTELRTVTDKPTYGENYVGDFCIHFSVMESAIPDNCKDIKIVVYRYENEMNPKEPAKATNLSMQLEMAKAVIPKKLFDMRNIIKVSMQLKMELPMDIAVPLFKEAEISLGIVKMSSSELYRQRASLTNYLKMSPYAENLYSFCVHSGQTLSLEQLHASHYSVSVAQALLSFWSQERNDYINDTIGILRAEFTAMFNEHQEKLRNEPAAISGTGGSDPSDNGNSLGLEERVDAMFEPFRHAIEVIDDIYKESVQNAEIVLQHCINMEEHKGLQSNVISPEVGGAVLRRSVWKKITAWQYCTTNLNLHMMMSKVLSHADLHNETETDNAYQHMHFVPTITMGCPAAHELKFHDGGLRRIFADVSESSQKLKWMHAIQSPTIEELTHMFKLYPKEAGALFGSKYALNTKEDLAMVLKRKSELARRIDICGSQALGSAVMAVRSICILATQSGGVYMDILARSLKIGFLVMFQSMLSTQGAELGMIEDLDVATLWLSLVSVRLVQQDTENAGIDGSVRNSISKDAKEELRRSSEKSIGRRDRTRSDDYMGYSDYVGSGNGIKCRRDLTGRMVLDIEVSATEGVTIQDAKLYMGDFKLPETSGSRNDTDSNDTIALPITFNSIPLFEGTTASDTTVYATAELFGVAFCQGVNEMQTLANLSSSRDVLRQTEINTASLTRLDSYYSRYRRALEYQLTANTPALVEVLTSMSSNNTVSGESRASNFHHSVTPGIAPKSGTLTVRRRKSIRQSVLTNNPNLTNDIVAAAVATLQAKVLSSNDRMLDQVREAIVWAASSPHDKHIDVLLKTSALCREMAGITAVLCKSGKDRTAMSVTLEIARGLVEDLGAICGQDVCQTLRMQGVRRMNVYANTGQSMFAFNQIQRLALPNCYRPPPGSHSGNVHS